jgi:hypothetical protein
MAPPIAKEDQVERCDHRTEAMEQRDEGVAHGNEGWKFPMGGAIEKTPGGEDTEKRYGHPGHDVGRPQATRDAFGVGLGTVA